MSSYSSNNEGLLQKSLISSLLALGIDPKIIDQRKKLMNRRTGFFHKLDQKTGNQILHFLFSCIDPISSSKLFRNCWPIFDKQQEAQFRSISQKYYKEIRQNEDLYPKNGLSFASGVNPSHPRFQETIFTLSCIALHAQQDGICTQPPLYCPRFSTEKKKNLAATNLIEKLKVFHYHKYIGASRTRKDELQKLKYKAREMTKFYHRMVSDNEVLAEEFNKFAPSLKVSSASEDRLGIDQSSFMDGILRNSRKKNTDLQNQWNEVDALKTVDSKEWPNIAVLTSRAGGLTTLDGVSYAASLVGTRWSQGTLSVLLNEGKLDLLSILQHSQIAFKELLIHQTHLKVKENIKDEVPVLLQEQKCSQSLAEGYVEAKALLDASLPPLQESVSKLRTNVGQYRNQFEPNPQDLNFFPPTPTLLRMPDNSDSGKRCSSFTFIELTPDNRMKRRSGASLRTGGRLRSTIKDASPASPISSQCGNKFKKYTSRLPLITTSETRACNDISEAMLIDHDSPLRSVNRIINVTNRCLDINSSSFSSMDSPKLNPTRNNSSFDPEIKSMMDRVEQLYDEQQSVVAIISPAVTKLIADVDITKSKTEIKFETRAQECKNQRNESKGKATGKFDCLSSLLGGDTSLSDDICQSNNIHDTFASNILALDSKLGDFSFDISETEFLQDEAFNSDEETFVDGKLFNDHFETLNTRSSLLPKTSVFNTLTEAVLADEVDTDVLFHTDFEDEIKRESICKRDSLLNLHGRNSIDSFRRLSNRKFPSGMLLDDSGPCLLSSSTELE